MLVLSRKLNEELVIGNNVVVRVIEIKGDRVKLGLVAPDAVGIMRGELRGNAKSQKAKHGLERPAT